jgi:glutamate/tyrosine decarboxylase-like PLP-dependent enzyme
LQLPFAKVPSDNRGRMDVKALEKMLEAGNVGCVVATEGTTGMGTVDPLPEILRLRERFGFRVHVDAAHGGYFTLVSNLSPETRASFDLINRADSIVIDPHKHGLQPYGCGCVLFRDPKVAAIYKHESPYTYFTPSDLHLGEISLECSRPGAAAVALWATQRLLPLVRGGEFAGMLEASRETASEFSRRITKDGRWIVPFAPELDIVVWAPRAQSVAEISELSQRIFDRAAKQNLHLALIRLPVRFFASQLGAGHADSDTVVCLRSVFMKPEHRDWLDRIWEILSRVADEILPR